MSLSEVACLWNKVLQIRIMFWKISLIGLCQIKFTCIYYSESSIFCSIFSFSVRWSIVYTLDYVTHFDAALSTVYLAGMHSSSFKLKWKKQLIDCPHFCSYRLLELFIPTRSICEVGGWSIREFGEYWGTLLPWAISPVNLQTALYSRKFSNYRCSVTCM